jgi:hypothetical protein
MGKKLPYTPKSRIANWIRRGWTQSRERAKVLKDAHYTCCSCGAKQSRAKGKEVYVEVHHKSRIDWVKIVEFIRKEVLDKPQVCMCKECHKEETKLQNEAIKKEKELQ